MVPEPVITPEVEMKQDAPVPVATPQRKAFKPASMKAKERGQDPKSLITEEGGRGG